MSNKTLIESMDERENNKSHIFVTVPGMTEREKEKALLENRILELENKLNYALIVINGHLINLSQ